MFRFGKHRKDGIVPTETLSEFNGSSGNSNVIMNPSDSIKFQTLPQPPTSSSSSTHASYSQHNGNAPQLVNRKGSGGPPSYQPPPPVGTTADHANGGIHKNDLFNHRYSHYVNYEELQQQIR